MLSSKINESYVYPNNNVYKGETINGRRHGKGKLTFNNGTILDSYWINDRISGNSKIIYPNGDIYEGELKQTNYSKSFRNNFKGNYFEDYILGKSVMLYLYGYGTMTYFNGINKKGEWVFNTKIKYMGTFKNGLPSGTGLMIYSNGDEYTGSWAFGDRNGKGRYVYNNYVPISVEITYEDFMIPFYAKTYEGEWFEDKKHGLGTLTFVNDNVYRGKFEKDIKI